MFKKYLYIGIMLLIYLVLCFSVAFSSNEFPTKPIECVVPYSAGGGTDIIVRAVAKYFDIGQPMIVVDMPGASGSIGTMEVYNAKPDGYKILSKDAHSMMFYCLTGNVPVPAWEDMIPLGNVCFDVDIITVPKNSPFNNFQDIVDYAKQNPNQLKWGACGTGGSNHVVSAVIWDTFGIDVNYVPFAGAAKSRVAAMGGHVDVLLTQISEVKSIIDSKELKPIIITSEKRSEFFPNVPTFDEMGIDISFGLFRGFWAPPKTPKEITEKLEAAFEKVANDTDFINFVVNDLNYNSTWMDGETTRNMLESIYPKYKKIIDEVILSK